MELLFPVEDEEIRRRVDEAIELFLSDTVGARELHADGTYELPDRRGRPAVNSQLALYQLAKDAVARREKRRPRPFFLPKDKYGYVRGEPDEKSAPMCERDV